MTHEEYVEAKQTTTEMKETKQINIFLVQPLSIAPSSQPSVAPISVIPTTTEVHKVEDITMISEISSPTFSRISIRGTPSMTLAPIKKENEEEKRQEISPKRLKRIKEMAIGPGPKKKPNVLMTYEGKKATTKNNEKTPRNMRGKIIPS